MTHRLDRYSIGRAILSFLNGQSSEELVERIFGEDPESDSLVPGWYQERLRSWESNRVMSALILHESDYRKFIDLAIADYVEAVTAE
jgi:hypothetical protein